MPRTQYININAYIIVYVIHSMSNNTHNTFNVENRSDSDLYRGIESNRWNDSKKFDLYSNDDFANPQTDLLLEWEDQS